MAAKFFGEFLLSQGIISQKILEQVIHIQKISNLKLGELAVANNYINEQQAIEINLRQQIENKRFGDIAENLGLINQQQLHNLLKLQKEKHKYFGDVLVELGICSQNELNQQLVAHETEKNNAHQLMLEAVGTHSLGSHLTALIETTNLFFLRVIHELSQFSDLIDRGKLLANFDVVCQIVLAYDKPITVTLATNSITAKIITSKFTLQPMIDCDSEFSKDGFGEFLNIVIGHLIDETDIAKNIERSATVLNVNLPQVCDDADEILIAKLNTQIGPLIIVISN